ncbi:MAG TPA: DUF1772 domain-containing protein [Xanthobacteraceae bacterium]|nr:DUF1772 domain-containing protein [Xanthobacteraceae bacterium]
MIIGGLAFAAATAFAAAAVYVNFAEQPARLALDHKPMLVQWQESYKRAAIMQASLALVACVLGVVAYFISHDWRWLVGAALSIASWPWTLVVIKPVNDALMTTAANAANKKTRELVERWGGLHAVRSALGLAAAWFICGR